MRTYEIVFYNIRVGIQFFMRDLVIYSKQWARFVINFNIILPCTMSFCFGYVMPRIMFKTITAQSATSFFVGGISWVIFPLAFLLHLDFLLDLEHERFIDYQLLRCSAWFFLIERVIFVTFICFLNIILFFPITKVLLGSYFFAPHLNWISLYLVLLCGSFFCSAFNLFFMCFIDSREKLGNFWLRFNHPMITLGGLFIPWAVMAKYSSVLGFVSLLNPILYLTEGVRRAILGTNEFFPIWMSCVGLCLFGCLFICLASYFFKKKVDHI